ncbi:MAG: helix-turn-helix domain-containing protein [Gemmatimonadales bacterium]
MSPAALQVIEDPAQAASVLNPIRLQLLNELRERDSAAGLARRLKLPRQAITYHVRQLEADGLVRFIEERRCRNCVERVVQATARAYVISPSALGVLAADPEQVGDRFSPAYLIAVAARMIHDVSALQHLAVETDQRLATIAIQTEVRFATPAEQHAFAYELADTLGQLVTKYHREDAPEGPEFSFTVTGHPTVSPAGRQPGKRNRGSGAGRKVLATQSA